jgi:hypothetical protein
MAADQPTSVSMELADFFVKIALDASDGVREALRLQEERRAELCSAASLGAAEFARLTVTDQELDSELGRLFPSSDPSRRHGVYAGAPYHPASRDGETESPPFKALAGIELQRADYTQSRESKSCTLAKTGVDKIIGAVRTRLGAAAQVVLRSTLAAGIPYITVASGKITARVSLMLQTAAQTPAGASNIVPRKDARLLVRMVDDRAPQTQQLRVDVLSELEITFKTVT